MILKGLDVSHYQGEIDWDKLVAANPKIEFVIIKAGEGYAWKDPQFERNVSEARRLHIPWGAYFYWYPQYDPTLQADNFIDILMGHAPEMGIWADFEQKYTFTATQNKAWAASRALTFMNYIDDFYKAGIYTSFYYWKDNIGNPSWSTNYPLWVANYFVTTPSIPSPWTKAVIWQDSSTGDGATYGAKSVYIDTDIWMGTDQEFKDFQTPDPNNVPVEPPAPEVPILFKAVCIRPEGVDTRNEFGVDIKQDLHFTDIVSVYEVKDNMYRIEPTIQRWVTTSTNYMLKLLPPEQTEMFTADEKTKLAESIAIVQKHL